MLFYSKSTIVDVWKKDTGREKIMIVFLNGHVNMLIKCCDL
jgi:hypothetical protein